MKIDGSDMRVELQGEGATFLWAHGLMSSMALEDSAGWFEWDAMSDAAALVRYDARGHGLSGASLVPEDYRWTTLADDMIAIADDLGVDSFVAGGQSMGCATALCTAAAAPSRVLALVLVNPPTAWETRAAQASIYGQLAALVEGNGTEAMVGVMRQQPLLPAWLLEAQPEIQEAYEKSVVALDPKALPAILRGAGLCDLPPRAELAKLGMPALILAWTEDPSHPLSTAEELHALLPEADLVVANGMDDVGQWPLLMREFVASHGWHSTSP